MTSARIARILPTILLLSVFASSAQAQGTAHMFPRFVNGQTGGGTFYLSTMTVIPWLTTSAAIDCTLRTYGSLLTISGSGTADTFNFTRYEPLGVIGMITPWNSPLLILSL